MLAGQKTLVPLECDNILGQMAPIKNFLLSSFLFACAGSAQDLTTVILGGTGPTPHLQTVIDGISDMLTANGVKVKVSAGDAKSRTVILEEMKSTNTKTLLYIAVHQAPKQRGK